VDVVSLGAVVVDDGGIVVFVVVAVVGDFVFDVADIVDAVDDVVVIFGDMVEARVVGIVDKSPRVRPHIVMFVMAALPPLPPLASKTSMPTYLKNISSQATSNFLV